MGRSAEKVGETQRCIKHSSLSLCSSRGRQTLWQINKSFIKHVQKRNSLVAWGGLGSISTDGDARATSWRKIQNSSAEKRRTSCLNHSHVNHIYSRCFEKKNIGNYASICLFYNVKVSDSSTPVCSCWGRGIFPPKSIFHCLVQMGYQILLLSLRKAFYLWCLDHIRAYI